MKSIFYSVIIFYFLINHSQADSISIFGGKSVDSNLIDFPKKAISNDLEIDTSRENINSIVNKIVYKIL
jgi:hypothetical protein